MEDAFYTYTHAGQRRRVVRPGQAPDGSDEVWEVTDYDARGNLLAQSRPDDRSETREYLDDGRLEVKTTTPDGGGAADTWTYTYDGLNRIDSRYAGGDGPAQEQDYRYDVHGRATSWSKDTDDDGSPDDGADAARTATYDLNGNRTSVEDQFGLREFTFNADDTMASHTLGANDSPRQVQHTGHGTMRDDGCFGYSYDGLDRLSTQGGSSSDCGNAPDSQWRYDGLHRQRSSDEPDGRPISISYDGFGGSVLSETGATGGGAPDVASSGSGLDKQRRMTVDADGSRLSVDHKTDTGTPGGQPNGSSGTETRDWLDTDGQGNVTSVTRRVGTDPAPAGGLCWARYNPWGAPDTQFTSNPTTTGGGGGGAGASPSGGLQTTGGLAIPGRGGPTCTDGAGAEVSTNPTPNDAWYRGQRRNPTSGHYQLGRRTYQPDLASFLSQDSYRTTSAVRDAGLGRDPLTRNRYTYVNGDPLNYYDPTGHEPDTLCGGDGRPSCDDYADQIRRNRAQDGGSSGGGGSSRSGSSGTSEPLSRSQQEVAAVGSAGLAGVRSYFKSLPDFARTGAALQQLASQQAADAGMFADDAAYQGRRRFFGLLGPSQASQTRAGRSAAAAARLGESSQRLGNAARTSSALGDISRAGARIAGPASAAIDFGVGAYNEYQEESDLSEGRRSGRAAAEGGLRAGASLAGGAIGATIGGALGAGNPLAVAAGAAIGSYAGGKLYDAVDSVTDGGLESVTDSAGDGLAEVGDAVTDFF